MRQGLSYFHSTIFTSLPLFYRRIDTALKQVCLILSGTLLSWFALLACNLNLETKCLHASMSGAKLLKLPHAYTVCAVPCLMCNRALH